jgi:arylsulfatase A-like enzyme
MRALFLLLLALLACHGPGDDGLQGAVLIVLDTLRADGLSAYGNPRPTSPNIDALAAEGALFEQTISHTAWTLPGFVGLLSARYPSAAVMPGRLELSLVENLRQAGFATAAFTEGAWVSSKFGLDRGFATWSEPTNIVPVAVGKRRMNMTVPQAEDVEETFRRANEWLGANADKRFFLLVHTYEVHTPYRRTEYSSDLEPGRLGATFEMADSGRLSDPTPDELHYIRALYDGGVAAADREVGGLLARLEALGVADRTLVVVTSDHGEDLGDRAPPGAGTHGNALYEELVRVPLVIRDPRTEHPGLRVDEQVRLVDVMPTILELLGLPADENADGRSLAPWLRPGERSARPAFGRLVSHHDVIRKESLRSDGYKLILNRFPQLPLVELYDLADDPRELLNLSEEQPELRERLEAELDELRTPRGRASYAPDEIPGELRQRLKALGYLQ